MVEERSNKHNPTMSFKARVTLAFVAVALMTTLLFIVVLSWVWNDQFRDYTRSTLEELASSAATSLARSWSAKGYWTTANLESAASSAEALEDIGVQILNARQIVVYDSTAAASGQSTGTYTTSLSLAPRDSEVVSVNVTASDGSIIGTVRVWVYGSEYLLTQRDVAFRAGSFQALVAAGAASILLALVLGLLLSRLLTKPVRTISHTAVRIKEGDLAARTNISGSDDLGQLGETFDQMAKKIESDRELEHRLTGDMAHELRTPLMSMLATVEAMQDEVYPCDQEHLGLVRNEITRMSRLVDDMLNLSRMESGSVRLVMRPVDLVGLVADVVNSHWALFDEEGLDLSFVNISGKDELKVELERDSFIRVLENILSNAMRYTTTPGSVTVRLDATDEQASVSVADTGIGIAKEDLDRVFSRFWRAEGSRSRAKGGLGVGLALCREIMERHHGRIDVESTPGVGSIFTLYLPLSQPHDAA